MKSVKNALNAKISILNELKLFIREFSITTNTGFAFLLLWREGLERVTNDVDAFVMRDGLWRNICVSDEILKHGLLSLGVAMGIEDNVLMDMIRFVENFYI